MTGFAPLARERRSLPAMKCLCCHGFLTFLSKVICPAATVKLLCMGLFSIFWVRELRRPLWAHLAPGIFPRTLFKTAKVSGKLSGASRRGAQARLESSARIDAQSRHPLPCHRPRMRTIQYSEALMMSGEAAAYWMPRLKRGMTAVCRAHSSIIARSARLRALSSKSPTRRC